jgi:hypothetical protein
MQHKSVKASQTPAKSSMANATKTLRRMMDLKRRGVNVKATWKGDISTMHIAMCLYESGQDEDSFKSTRQHNEHDECSMTNATKEARRMQQRQHIENSTSKAARRRQDESSTNTTSSQ